MERQDLLMNASSAEIRFHATGGEFLNSDDYFISQERKQRHLRLQDVSNKKKVHIDCINQETEGKSVIENFQTVKYKDAYNDEHAKSLQLKDLKTLYKWKYGNNLANGTNKAELPLSWITAKNAGKK